jgi:hypothetical protein
MVGGSGGGLSCRSGSRFSKKLSLGSQGMDGDWPRLGLDQHENYSRDGLLCHRYPHWNVQTMVGKGSHGPEVATRPGQLSHYSQAPAGIPFDETILSR